MRVPVDPTFEGLDPVEVIQGTTGLGVHWLVNAVGDQPACGNLALYLASPTADRTELTYSLPEPFFPSEDTAFIQHMLRELRASLGAVARRHAAATVLNQAVTWCHRHLGAGAAFAMVPHHEGNEPVERMRLVCASSNAYPMRRLYERERHPIIFSAHDSGGVEVSPPLPSHLLG